MCRCMIQFGDNFSEEEQVRNKISCYLMDTSEQNPMDVNIILETDEDMGLSDNDKLTIVKIWQHPTEGLIDYIIYGLDEVQHLEDHEELWDQILNYLENS